MRRKLESRSRTKNRLCVLDATVRVLRAIRRSLNLRRRRVLPTRLFPWRLPFLWSTELSFSPMIFPRIGSFGFVKKSIPLFRMPYMSVCELVDSCDAQNRRELWQAFV